MSARREAHRLLIVVMSRVHARGMRGRQKRHDFEEKVDREDQILDVSAGVEVTSILLHARLHSGMQLLNVSKIKPPAKPPAPKTNPGYHV
jgi:hypothetical protein